MNVLGIINSAVWIAAGEGEEVFDDKGYIVTHSPFLPETAEIIWGGLASVIIFAVLIKAAGPMVKKSMQARTARIQKELDDAAADQASAASEAEQIRQAKGDIQAERARILAEADQQASALIAEGRSRIAAELADLEARATAEIATIGSRVNDELRAEISRLSTAAVDHVVSGSLDDATHQQLIESFISRVGANS